MENAIPVDPYVPRDWKTSDGILLNQSNNAPAAWKNALTIPALSRLSEIPESGTQTN